MRFARLLVAATVALLAACSSDPTSTSVNDQSPDLAVGQGIPLDATVEFGRDDVGSPFPPPSGHDASGHARDKMLPRNVSIRAGGSVTFRMGVFHQVTIYDQGTEPGDIDLSNLLDLTAPPPAPPGTVIIPAFLSEDPNNRLAQGPFSFAPMTWTSPPGTFDVPGKYLVICSVVPHVVASNMYAWVTVK